MQRPGPSRAPWGEHVPTCESLRTVALCHRFGDLFNPPGLTNQWGCVQATLDPTGLRSIAFPPLAMGEQRIEPWWLTADVLTGVLFVDGEYFTATRTPVWYVWQPDRVERFAQLGDLELFSVTVVPFGVRGAAVQLFVRNVGRARRRAELRLGLRGSVTKAPGPWAYPSAPGEPDNEVAVDELRGAVCFTSRRTGAVAVQGAWPRADRVLPRWLVVELDLAPGEWRSLAFAVVLADRLEDALAPYDALVRDVEGAQRRTAETWDRQLEAAFTPGNGEFSGHLPVLVTGDEAVRRLYHTAVTNALFLRRTTPASALGPTYVTLGPRYWQTASFLWDTSLAATLLALLDPEVLRGMLEAWMRIDVHRTFGTDYLTGTGIGPWYAANDYAMCRMAGEYLRWTGDLGWLDHEVAGKTVLERLVGYATHWRALDRSGRGLADYGEVGNLLEAVGSYVHEVASLNAANVWSLRVAAELLEARGRGAEAAGLRLEATALLRRLHELYEPGSGVWRCRLPDGRTHEVRHGYDFATVLATVGQDLTAEQRAEMVRFFREELQTPAWMRALSTRDLDATFSTRPDHQWTGAYAAWPAVALDALFRAGEHELATAWMRGLARTALQGPIAQAHFAETAFGPEAGEGALKAPSDQPWINDWACLSGAAYLEPILTGLFGVRATLGGEITARPHLDGPLRGSELRGVRYWGRLYTVSASGVRPA